MIAIGQFVLYSFYYDKHSFYYIKWTKEVFSLLASLPAVYLLIKFSFRHWETTSVLITHIIELTLSVIFLLFGSIL